MASFVERVQILIETKIDNAKTQLSSLKTSISEADGVGGKLKATASGLGDIMSSVGSAIISPAGIATGVAAVSGLAIKAVTQFENLGLSVDKFSTATGTSAEQASKWIEVAKDHGVAVDTLQSAMGRMNRTAEQTPAVFDAMGVAIARNKDGTIDSNATFLNAIDVLKNTHDAGLQAEIGMRIFGKGWQGMAGLISEGAPKLRSDLASVQPSKIFNDKDVQASKNLRDGFDAIKDAGEGLFLTLGKSLAPVIAELAPKIAELITKVEPLVSAIGTALVGAFKALEPAIDGALAVLGPLTKALGWLVSQTPNVIAALGGSRGGLQAQSQSTKDLIDQFVQLNDKYKNVGSSSIKFTGDAHAVANALEDQKALTGSNTDAIEKMTAAVKAHGDELSGKVTGTMAGFSQAILDQRDASNALETSTQTLANAAIHADDVTAAHNATLAAAATAAAAAKAAHDDLVTTMGLEATAEASATKDLQDNVTALEADQKAHQDLIDAQRAATDSTFALHKATADYEGADKDLSAALKAAKTDQAAITVAFDDHTQKAIAVADAQGKVYDQTIKASGGTETATQKIDLFNHALAEQATSKIPGANDAIFDYIGQVNKIPESTLTDIKTQFNKDGDLDKAKAAIDAASVTRTASLVVDADGASIAEANRKIQEGIDTNVLLRVGLNGAPVKRAGGGRVGANETLTEIDEIGPEILRLPGGTEVTTARATQQILAQRARGGGGTTNNYYTFNAGPGMTAADIVAEQRRWERRNGRPA